MAKPTSDLPEPELLRMYRIFIAQPIRKYMSGRVLPLVVTLLAACLASQASWGASPAFAQGADDPSVQTVTIGALVPQTGRSDDAGAHRTFATELAVEDFNGYLDRKNAAWRLAVDIRDTTASPAGSTEQARLLYNDGVRIISGPSASSGVSAIKANVTADGIGDLVLISCCSTSPALAQDDNIFRLAPDDRIHGLVIADLMYGDGKEVMIPVWINDTFGHGLRDSTAAEFERLGGTVYDVGSYEPCGDMCTSNGFAGLVGNLNATVSEHAGRVGADKIFVFFIGFAETDDVIREAAKYPALRTVQWVGSDANVNDNSLVDDPVIAEFLDDANFRSCIFAEDPTSQTYMGLQARFAQQFSSPPNVYAYSTYDTIWIAGLAIDGVITPDGTIDIGSITDSIGTIASDYSGALGDIELNDNGDLSETSYAVHGIENRMWAQIGTYTPGVGLVTVDAVSPGGGDDDEWQTAPTFGISAQTGSQLVSCGYSMDGTCRDVLDYHVDYRRESIQTDTSHNFTLRAHSVAGVQQFQIGFGVPEVGSPMGSSEAVLTVELGRNYAVDSTYEVLGAAYTDPNDVIGEAVLGVDLVGCMSPGDPTRCVELTIDGLIFREQMYHEPFVIFVMDAERRSAQNYMNDGLLVHGDSMNPAPEETAGIYKRGNQHDAVIVSLERTDKLADLWADQWGNEWARNSHGTWYRTVPDAFERHQDDAWKVMTRINSNFASLVQAERDRAILVFDSQQIQSDPGTAFAYEYPGGIHDDSVRLEALADAIAAEQLRAQDVLDEQARNRANYQPWLN